MSLNNSSSTFADLVRLLQRLRGPEGCPWDREQTPESLQPYLLEETYEVLESLDRGIPEEICEELGDLLLQVVFQAQIFSEKNLFTIDDVIHAITTKLIRRHPHVFEGTGFDSLEELNHQWEQIKKQEKRKKTSREPRAKGVGTSQTPLPALMLAKKLIGGRKISLDPTTKDVVEKLLLSEECPAEAQEEKICEAICSLVALGDQIGIDAEQALRRHLSRRSTQITKNPDDGSG